MRLNSKQKSLCLILMATTELYRKETKNKKQQENDKSAFGSDASHQWFLVYPITRTLVFSLTVTNCSGERFF